MDSDTKDSKGKSKKTRRKNQKKRSLDNRFPTTITNYRKSCWLQVDYPYCRDKKECSCLSISIFGACNG